MTDASNPIEAVRARLDGGRKWHKDTLGDWRNPDASVCVVGACHAARQWFSVAENEVTPWGVTIDEVVAEQFRDRVSSERLMDPHSTVIPDFNDHPDTTWPDVELVLDKASVRWDEQVR